MRYQAVIFDLDGTLSDSAPGIINGVKTALTEMNWPFPSETHLRRFLGPPLVLSFMAECGMTEDQALLAQDYYREFYIRQGHFENAVFPGIRLLLHALKQQGAFLGVATYKPIKPTLKILQAFDLLRYFDAVQGPDESSEAGITKTELIKRANPKGLPAVMIGDRATDIKAAHEAGISSIGAAYGYGTKEELLEANADFIVSDVKELYQVLGVSMPKKQGYFISLEGNDGSGKSTQARMLAENLSKCGHDVLLTREPGGTRVGEKIRELLLDRENTDMDDLTEAMLYAAARAQHVRQVILPAIQQGQLVVSDRFVDSSLAYQGVGRGLGIEEVRNINAPAVKGCMPNTTVFLKVDPELGMRRRTNASEKDRLEQEGKDFHQRVAEAFDQFAESNPRFLVIPSMDNKADTAKLVFEQVKQRLAQDGQP